VAFLLGPEFPSVIGALVGLGLIVSAARYNILLPRTPWRFAGDPLPDEHGSETTHREPDHHEENTPNVNNSSANNMGAVAGAQAPALASSMSLARAWLPYLIAALILILTRLDFLPFKAWLQGANLQWSGLLGTDINASLAPFYLPGSLFALTALLTIALHRIPAAEARHAWADSARSLLPATIALATSVPMVRIFLNSGVNAAELAAMPSELAQLAAGSIAGYWPLVAPFIGALGSFIAGSATFSNMMFAGLQQEAAVSADLPERLILALQMIGSNAGNMICVMNVVAAAAVVKLNGQEGQIIRLTLGPMIYYCVAAGLVGMLLVSVF